jgi:uncharacterized membrane protein
MESTQWEETVAVENKQILISLIIRVVISIVVIFIGREIADLLIAKIPNYGGLIDFCSAIFFVVVALFVVRPLLRPKKRG